MKMTNEPSGKRRFRGALLGIFRHAFLMVERTRRSYAMLSVTIVLSFSFLLGFLGWSDSSLYNTYKGCFAEDRNLVITYAALKNNRSAIELLKTKAKEYGADHNLEILMPNSMALRSIMSVDESALGATSLDVKVLCLPRHSWLLFGDGDVLEVNWLDGKEHQDIDVGPGEILMDEQLFYALGLNQEEEPFFNCRLEQAYMPLTGDWDDTVFSGRFKVIGTIPGSAPFQSETEEGKQDERRDLVFSQSDLNPDVMPVLEWQSIVAFYTEDPNSVYQLAGSMGFSREAIYFVQDDAVEQMHSRTFTKTMIVVALLFLLGINLYGSFANALNDRKFEIGVKRALGASGFQIVRQFLYESLLVMLFNILLSIWLVVTVGLGYKFIVEHIPDQFGMYPIFTLYLSPGSAAMFAVCSLALTLVFSLIFAFQSTRVQIVDYLKAE